MEPDSLLEINHLTVAYAGTAVLDDVTLRVARGGVHGVLGEDGAGKTTLMKVLGGVLTADKYDGAIMLAGQALALRSVSDALHHGIVLVPRKISVFDHMSVADNVMVASWQQEHRFTTLRRRTEDQAREILAHWGIDLDLAASVRSMSPLQRRCLMIARGLATSPQLLIVDEPVSGIPGHHAASQLLLTIRRIAERGVTCLYLAKRPAEAMQVAQAITVLRDGEVVNTWERVRFDEAELLAAMASQRLGDSQVERHEDDFGERSGVLGPLREALERWVRPGS
jgi:ABC-type sugar transport system ATPase subunit